MIVPTTFKSVRSSRREQSVPTCMNKPVNNHVQAGQPNHVQAGQLKLAQHCSCLSTGNKKMCVFSHFTSCFHSDVYRAIMGNNDFIFASHVAGKNKTIIARCHELRAKHHDLRTATRGFFVQSKSYRKVDLALTLGL